MDSWCEKSCRQRGAVIGMEQCWRLAKAWFPEIAARGWHRLDRGEMQAIFDGVGLTGPFWRVA